MPAGRRINLWQKQAKTITIINSQLSIINYFAGSSLRISANFALEKETTGNDK